MEASFKSKAIFRMSQPKKHKKSHLNRLKFPKSNLLKLSQNRYPPWTKTFKKARFKSKNLLKSSRYKNHGKTKNLSDRKNRFKCKFYYLAKKENLYQKFNRRPNLYWKARTLKFKFLYKEKILTETRVQHLLWPTTQISASLKMWFFCQKSNNLRKKLKR